MSKRKYRPGRKFKSVQELIVWAQGGGFIYLRKSARPTHHSWILSMTVHTLQCYIRRNNDLGAREAWKIERRSGEDRRHSDFESYGAGYRHFQRRKP